MTVGGDVTVTSAPPETEPGYTINTFSLAEQETFRRSYRAKYPETKASPGNMKAAREMVYHAPPKYSDHVDHHRNFALAVRSRKAVVEDPVFGFRAAGPALLSNLSYFENRVIEWDAATMKIKA
jgi:hypothetical protein